MTTWEKWVTQLDVVEKIDPIDWSDTVKPTPLTSEQMTEYRAWSLLWYHECLKNKRFEANPFDGTWVMDVDFSVLSPTKAEKKRKRKEKEVVVPNYQTFNPDTKKEGVVKISTPRSFPNDVQIVFVQNSMILHYRTDNKKTTVCKKKVDRVAVDEEKYDPIYQICPKCNSEIK